MDSRRVDAGSNTTVVPSDTRVRPSNANPLQPHGRPRARTAGERIQTEHDSPTRTEHHTVEQAATPNNIRSAIPIMNLHSARSRYFIVQIIWLVVLLVLAGLYYYTDILQGRPLGPLPLGVIWSGAPGRRAGLAQRHHRSRS